MYCVIISTERIYIYPASCHDRVVPKVVAYLEGITMGIGWMYERVTM